MHHNYRRKFNAAQYNWLDSRYFNLKWYRTHYNRVLRRKVVRDLIHERFEALPFRLKPRDFNGAFI